MPLVQLFTLNHPMPFLKKSRMYEGGSFETVRYDSDTASHHCVHLISLFLNQMSPRTSCIHIYFWNMSCRRGFKLLSERVLIVDECAKRRVVKLNVSLTSSRCVRESGVKTEIFFLCLGNANSFESLFTPMMCCLIKSIYI